MTRSSPPAKPVRRPRLGEREGLQIELTAAAVASYRRSRERSARITLTDAEAREELDDVARESYIVETARDVIVTRARVRRLEVDATCRFIRIAPDRVRMIACSSRPGATPKRSGWIVVYDGVDDGRRTVGFLRRRADGTGVEWREVASSPDGPTPTWGYVPARIVELVREQAQAGHPATLRWLERHGAA